MARTFIAITQTAPQAALLKSYIELLRQAYDKGVRCQAEMNNMNDGTIWSDIEAAFGLPTGQGQNVYNLVNGSVGAMTGAFQNSNAKTITEQVG